LPRALDEMAGVFDSLAPVPFFHTTAVTTTPATESRGVSLIVPLGWQTKRDPQHMRVSNLSTTRKTPVYGSSVTPKMKLGAPAYGKLAPKAPLLELKLSAVVPVIVLLGSSPIKNKYVPD